MSQWHPEYRQPRRALPPSAVPPQFQRRRPVRDRLAARRSPAPGGSATTHRF